MSSFAKFISAVIVAAIVISSSAAAYSNWDAMRSYLIGDANAPGELLYFARPG